MTRRLTMSSIALGMLFLPACSLFTPRDVMIPMTPPGSYHKTPVTMVPLPQNHQVAGSDGFATVRTEQPPVPAGPRIVAQPLPGERESAKRDIQAVQHQENANEAPVIHTPRLIPTNNQTTPTPEPVVDAEGVIRPHWPVIPGALVPTEQPAPTIRPNPPLPPLKAINDTPDLPPVKTMTETPPAVLTLPTKLPESVIGSSTPETPTINVVPPPPVAIPPVVAPPGIIPPVSAPPIVPSPVHDVAPPLQTILPVSHEPKTPVMVIPNHPNESAPIIAPVHEKTESRKATAITLPAPSDTPLIQAVRAFQQNKPQEALEHLKAYDAQTQQVLISMMPVLVQLSEGKLQQMKREEMDALLEQLTRVPPILRTKASLQANKILLCSKVRKFGDVDAFSPNHEFRPGDMVYLYVEMSNFSCTPIEGEGYKIALNGQLELRDSSNVAVWKAHPRDEQERVSTPPQDYYRAYRFCLPSTLSSGKYTLAIRVVDVPTERDATNAISFRVGTK